jgi:hypothetical protein
MDTKKSKVFQVYSLYDEDRRDGSLMDNTAAPAETIEKNPLSESASVEFAPPTQKEEQEPSKNASTPEDEKRAGAADLQDVSRDHIEIITTPKDIMLPREIDTSLAKKELGTEMEETSIEVLSENNAPNTSADNIKISQAEEFEINTILNKGFLDKPENTPMEKDLTAALIQRVDEEMVDAAVMLKEKEKDGDQEKLKSFQDALINLSQRVEDTIKTGGDKLEENLKKLLEEIATVGSKEWEERFVTEEPKKSLMPALETKTAAEETLAADKTLPEEKSDEPKRTEKKQEIATEKEAKISAEIEAQFQKDFSMAQEDLKNIITTVEAPEGEKTVRFSDLTQGQQFLLLENLKDFALDNAKEQALKNFTEGEKEKYSNAGFIKKAILSFTKTYRRAADMAQIEKDILAKPEMDKGTYTEVLREMLGAASEAPEAEWKDGKLQVNFALEKDFSGIDLKKLNRETAVRGFNDAAAKFADIPAEWAFSKNEGEQKQYRDSKITYAEARGQLLNLKAEGGKEDEALLYIATLDKKVQFTQLFQTNPDVEKAFSETKDKNAWWEGIKAMGAERGKLMFMGKALSTIGAGVAISVGSGFAAPLAVALAGGFAGGALSGGIIGRYMAGKRAGQEIEDKKNLAEIGLTDQSNETEFRAAHEEKEGIEIGTGLADKLGYAVERVLGAGTEEEKGQLLKVLGDRMYYTEKKIAMGVVNFSEGAEGFKSRYELLNVLAAARTLHEMNEPETNEKIENKIDEMLGTQKTRIESAEEKYKSEKTRQGMKYGILLGGTFGTLLSSISYTHAHGGGAPAQPEIPTPAPKIPAPGTDNTIMEKLLPNTNTLPKNTLADDILNKFKFAKNYELPDTVTEPALATPSTNVTAGHEGVIIPSAVKIPESILPQPKMGFSVNHEGTLIPEAVKIPESTLPTQSEMGFSADHGTVVPEAVKIPQEIFPEPQGYGVAEVIISRAQAIENSLHELGKTYTVSKGDTIWGINKTQLGGNEYWKQLGATPEGIRQQNFILDTMRHDLLNRSSADLIKMGIKSGDINRIYPGDKIDFSKVFDKDELSRIFNRAEHLQTQAPPHVSPVPEVLPHAAAAPAQAEVILQPTASPIKHVATDMAIPEKLYPKPNVDERLVPNQIPNHNVSHAATEPLQPESVGQIHHEVIVPTAGHFEAFSIRSQDIPANYKTLVYETIHSQHPNIKLGVYDTPLKEYLAAHPNGLKELNAVFQMKGVTTPEKLPQETLNGSILDYWTRQAVQDELNQRGVSAVHDIAQQIPTQQNAPQQEMRAPIYDETARRIQQDAIETQRNINQSAQETWANTHAPEALMDPYMVSREQIPPQYTQWVQQGMAQQYPDVPPQFYQQRMVDMMARDGYNNTVDTVNRMSQLFGVRMPVQFIHQHSNDTLLDVGARMAWQTAQGSGHLPPNFPNLPSIFGTLGRFTSPNPTDQSIGVSDVSTFVNRTIGDWATNRNINNSGVTHK